MKMEVGRIRRNAECFGWVKCLRTPRRIDIYLWAVNVEIYW